MSDSQTPVLAIPPRETAGVVADILAGAGAPVVRVPNETRLDATAVLARLRQGEFRGLVCAQPRVHDIVQTVETVRIRYPELPVIVLVDGPESAATVLEAGATVAVRTDSEPDQWQRILRQMVDTELGGSTATSSESTEADTQSTIDDDVQRLHEVASALDERRTEWSVSELAVEGASELFQFDACVVAEARNDEFTPLAATAAAPTPGRSRLRLDEGIAGETYRTGEPVLTGDVAESAVAAGGCLPYRSVLSLPLGDIGVFQLLSERVGAYDQRDLDFGELLVAHVAHAYGRVRYERELTKERDRATELFQNVPDPAVRYVFEDGTPRIDAVNSAFVRHFGYEPSVAVGERTLDLLVPTDQRSEAVELYDAIMDGEHTDREVERRTTEGTAPFLLRSVPVSSEDGSRMGYIIYTDIGELVEREQALERQNEQLDTFASMVSHDLRNPLSSAMGYLELARESGDGSHLDIVEEEHDRMLSMIDDLLTLARHGDSIGSVEPLDLETAAQDAWETVDTEDARLGAGALPRVEGDPERVQQVFENLFRNAVEHGGGDVTVTVDTLADGSGFYVADDGPGVPASIADDIFEMGMTTAGGSGGTASDSPSSGRSRRDTAGPSR
ncbi:sensor histidine kinase [Haloarchaeobius iranensis]|uniref:histidine kinase n=1 Tax=Haloarchaeobius iranensis TaxID=996166 RepID=A0A1G9ZBQ7_9EURY|nr:histidine kinase dimerization/phospho-acceptor domain-containing protein [Haloarchaeobius iranensis]SDN18744.1 PAS domain S-box-containing protein [Haloarchaeobius iranensis]